MTNKTTDGKITQIIGPVVDFKFDQGNLPAIGNAIEVTQNDQRILFETMQHLGNDSVRTVAMSSTDGLIRNTVGRDTGQPITVPVGKETLGRIMNVTGDAIDYGAPIQTKERRPIFRKPPELSELLSTESLFETGIKVIDLLAPYPTGGKVGLFGGAGVGESVQGYRRKNRETKKQEPKKTTNTPAAPPATTKRTPTATPE